MKFNSPFILQNRDAFTIKVCPSGIVHLSIGILSLRIEGHTFIGLVHEMSKVAKGLQQAYQAMEQTKDKESKASSLLKNKFFCSLWKKSSTNYSSQTASQGHPSHHDHNILFLREKD
jgi:hypothetical protein